MSKSNEKSILGKRLPEETVIAEEFERFENLRTRHEFRTLEQRP